MRISSVSCSALMVPVEGTALSIERRALSAANALADRRISFAFSNPVIRFFTFLVSAAAASEVVPGSRPAFGIGALLPQPQRPGLTPRRPATWPRPDDQISGRHELEPASAAPAREPRSGKGST